MENSHNKNNYDEDYFKIKDVKIDDKFYSVFLDIDTQTQIIALDSNNKEVLDKDLLKKIAMKIFKIHSEIHYDKNEDEKKEINDEHPGKYKIKGNIYREFDSEEYQKLLDSMKQVFFKKFGNEAISEEEYEKRIKRNLKHIYLTDNIESEDGNSQETVRGLYDREKKIIKIVPSGDSKTNADFLFHEFIHAIVGNGTTKLLSIEDTVLEYARALDEGIVSNIEFFENVISFNMYKENSSYFCERRLVNLMAKLYENTEEGRDKLFFAEYIKNPETTIQRIAQVFIEDEKNINKGINVSENQLKKDALQRALRFIVNLDNVSENYQISTEKYNIDQMIFSGELSRFDAEINLKNINDRLLQSYNDNLENFGGIIEPEYNLLEKMEAELTNIFIRQQNEKKIESRKQLYVELYRIEGFNSVLTDKSEKLKDLKSDMVRNFMAQHRSTKLETIIKGLPKQNFDTIINYEERLLNSLFKENKYETIDFRYEDIRNTFRKLYVEQEMKKMKKEFEDEFDK